MIGQVELNSGAVTLFASKKEAMAVAFQMLLDGYTPQVFERTIELGPQTITMWFVL